VYMGDGVAPIRQILQSIRQPERPVIISFEVFNKNYYAQDALQVARTSLEKMKAASNGV
jgi:2-keto-myo-inositol isomerase